MSQTFLQACRKEPVSHTPIWLMRQAGRYQKEYRAIREKVSFLELCKSPDLAAEVTLLPVTQLGVDAAILFADILLILEPMGIPIAFEKGDGPVIGKPIRTAADVDAVTGEIDAGSSLGYVLATVRKVRAALDGKTPLIGFAGAPFTLASYAIEGGGSKQYIHTKSLMYRDEGCWNALLAKLTEAVTRYLNAQIAAGAQCVQLFDSWVGALSPSDYRRYVMPHMKRLFAGLDRSVPHIHFGTGNPALLPLQKEAGGDVIGLDWRVELGPSWDALGDTAVQGNLDPVVLFSDAATIRAKAADVLRQAGGRRGHVFNLGHGILPETPFDHVRLLVDTVHELSARG